MNTDIIEIRKSQLKKWMEQNYRSTRKQADLIRDMEKKNPGVHISQAEISAILRDRPIGEKKARKLESLIGLPIGWLDNPSTHPLDDYKIVYDRASETEKNLVLSVLQAIKLVQESNQSTSS